MKEIILSGVFGWEITPDSVRSQLAEANGDDIEIVISSVGGDVYDGIDIYNQVSNYKRKNSDAQMSLRMAGVVASMAAYLSMNPSFDLVSAEDNAAFMVHNAWAIAVGDHNEMYKTGDWLKGLSSPMAKLVSTKMGISEPEAQEILDNETWFFGQQIVDAGFADGVVDRPSGELDRDKSSAMTEMKIIHGKIMKRAFEENALKAAASIKSNHNKPKQNAIIKEELEMDEKEVRASAVAEERERIKSLQAIKVKYSQTPSAEKVAEIVDKAIVEGTEKAEVLTELVLTVNNGNTLAALDSPGDTPQGEASTVSGEVGKPKEEDVDYAAW